ncbi:MAG: glycoside hydrolase family 88 protein [Treponema sp.]|nr:glycoside hydrolase family 88 protein [Treponema sp.]
METSYTLLIAGTIMRRYPHADDYPYRSWCYPQGFMLWGFIRLYEKTGDERYRQYVLDYCEKHVGENGGIPAFTGISLDDIMAGSVLVWAWQTTRQEKYRIASRHVRQAFDDYPRNEDGGFWHGRHLPREMWVDGLFMGLMFLTRYGKYVDDRDFCFGETVRQLSIVFDRCEKDGTGLLYHAYSEDGKAPWAHPVTGTSPEVWSEGLGWYAMILADALELLPKDFQGYERLSMQLCRLIDSLEKVQDPASGLWYQVVDKPSHPKNWHDTSGSAMFLYAVKKAGLLGIAGSEQCDRIAARAFGGIKTKCILDYEGNANIHDACNGLCVQSDYDAYVDYARNINCQEAVAACLWAGQIMEFGL